MELKSVSWGAEEGMESFLNIFNFTTCFDGLLTSSGWVVKDICNVIRALWITDDVKSKLHGCAIEERYFFLAQIRTMSIIYSSCLCVCLCVCRYISLLAEMLYIDEKTHSSRLKVHFK